MTHANLSRRTIMSGAAALPAVAALPVASALASTGSPDVELLRLGVKLAIAEPERSAQLAIDRAEREAIEAEAERRSCITRHDALAAGDFSSFLAARNQIRCELGFGTDDDEDENGDTLWDRINSRVNPILNAILGQRATTLEGLKIQTRAFAMTRSEIWGGTLANTYEKAFIESACSFFSMNAKSIALGTEAAAVQS